MTRGDEELDDETCRLVAIYQASPLPTGRPVRVPASALPAKTRRLALTARSLSATRIGAQVRALRMASRPFIRGRFRTCRWFLRCANRLLAAAPSGRGARRLLGRLTARAFRAPSSPLCFLASVFGMPNHRQAESGGCRTTLEFRGQSPCAVSRAGEFVPPTVQRRRSTPPLRANCA